MGNKKQLFRRRRRKCTSYPLLVGRIDKPGYLCGFRLTIPLFDKEEDLVVDSKYFSQAQEKEGKIV